MWRLRQRSAPSPTQRHRLFYLYASHVRLNSYWCVSRGGVILNPQLVACMYVPSSKPRAAPTRASSARLLAPAPSRRPMMVTRLKPSPTPPRGGGSFRVQSFCEPPTAMWLHGRMTASRSNAGTRLVGAALARGGRRAGINWILTGRRGVGKWAVYLPERKCLCGMVKMNAVSVPRQRGSGGERS